MNKCCQKAENLVEIERRVPQEGVMVVVRECSGCKAKHHEMSVPPVSFGVSGKSV